MHMRVCLAQSSHVTALLGSNGLVAVHGRVNLGKKGDGRTDALQRTNAWCARCSSSILLLLRVCMFGVRQSRIAELAGAQCARGTWLGGIVQQGGINERPDCPSCLKSRCAPLLICPCTASARVGLARGSQGTCILGATVSRYMVA